MVYFLTAEQVSPLKRNVPGENVTQHGPSRTTNNRRQPYVGGVTDCVQPFRDRSKRIEVNTWRGSGHGLSGIPESGRQVGLGKLLIVLLSGEITRWPGYPHEKWAGRNDFDTVWRYSFALPLPEALPQRGNLLPSCLLESCCLSLVCLSGRGLFQVKASHQPFTTQKCKITRQCSPQEGNAQETFHTSVRREALGTVRIRRSWPLGACLADTGTSLQ